MGNGRTEVPAMAGVVLGILLLAAASMPGPARAGTFVPGDQARQAAGAIGGNHVGHADMLGGEPLPSAISPVQRDRWPSFLKTFVQRGFSHLPALQGLGLNRAKGADGAADGFVVRDVVVRGLDLRFDRGVQFAFGRHLALDLQALKRQGAYVELKYILAH